MVFFRILVIVLSFGLNMSQNSYTKSELIENIKAALRLENPCDPSPCMNDGACRSPDGIYHCLCAPGWGGKICDISKHDMKCSNTSVCATEYFCNYDYQQEGFCEKCPRIESVLTCNLQQLVNEKGIRECEKSCEYGSHLPNTPIGIQFVKLKWQLVIVLCALALMSIILISIMGLNYYKKKRLKRNPVNNKLIWRRNSLYDSNESLDSLNECSGLPSWLKERKEMIFSKSLITKGRQLGKGQFGAVFKGQLNQGNAVFPIAIKYPTSNDVEKIDLFLEEAKTMLRIGGYHDYIVNLQGLVCETNGKGDKIPEVSLILEYCSKGDLRSYLIKYRQDFENSLNETYHHAKSQMNLSTSKSSTHSIRLLYRWAYQIADGMDFLADRNIYHGDLAARNILLTDALDTKISDFGLSRRLYSDPSLPQSLRMKKEDAILPLPIKWIALELLTRQEFIPIRSDVWSFGVTIWEIFSVGKEPYGVGIDINTLVYDLLFGVRLPAPKYCPSPISDMISKCFFERPTLRPDFKEIKSTLDSAYVSLASKTNPIDLCFNIETSINATKSNAMKIRYTSILKENLDNEILEVEPKSNDENQGSIQYSTLQNADKNERESGIRKEDDCSTHYSILGHFCSTESVKEEVANANMMMKKCCGSSVSTQTLSKIGIPKHFWYSLPSERCRAIHTFRQNISIENKYQKELDLSLIPR